jgi:hypothetical protein
VEAVDAESDDRKHRILQARRSCAKVLEDGERYEIVDDRRIVLLVPRIRESVPPSIVTGTSTEWSAIRFAGV